MKELLDDYLEYLQSLNYSDKTITSSNYMLEFHVVFKK